MLRISHYIDNRLTDSERLGCQPYAWACRPLLSQEDSRYSFLLEAESIPGKDEVNLKKKISYLIGARTSDLPACSIAPQPSTLPRTPQWVQTASYLNVQVRHVDWVEVYEPIQDLTHQPLHLSLLRHFILIQQHLQLASRGAVSKDKQPGFFFVQFMATQVY
jgi:hypothetical protein